VDDLSGTFIVCEEEEAILQDGAAQGATELVADQDRLLRSTSEGVRRRGERSDCVKDRVAEIVVSLAMEFVVAAANADVDDGTGGAAVLCAVVVGLNAKLGDSVGRGRNGLIGEALVGGAVGVVVETVEKKVVEFAALTVDVEGGVAAAVRRVLKDVWRTPGTSAARSAYARPFSGRFSTSRVPITWPRSLLSVSSRAAAASTVTVSVLEPIFKATSTR